VKLGRVIGRVVADRKHEAFEGIKLMLIQPLDSHREPSGDVLVGMDAVRAGEGDLIMYESSKEAGQCFPNWYHPGDVSIMGIIDHIEGEDAETTGGG